MEAVILVGIGDHGGLAPAVFLDRLGDMADLVIAVLETAVGLAAVGDLTVDSLQGPVDLIIGHRGFGLIGIDDPGQITHLIAAVFNGLARRIGHPLQPVIGAVLVAHLITVRVGGADAVGSGIVLVTQHPVKGIVLLRDPVQGIKGPGGFAQFIVHADAVIIGIILIGHRAGIGIADLLQHVIRVKAYSVSSPLPSLRLIRLRLPS